MDILSPSEINEIIGRSEIIRKYNQVVDRESAYEILAEKIEIAQSEEHQEEMRKQQNDGRESTRREKSTFEKVVNSPTTRQIGRTIARELTRGLLGVLGIKTRSTTTRKKTGWF
jgi:hypothetical protein